MNVDDFAFLDLEMKPRPGTDDFPCLELSLSELYGPNYQVVRSQRLARSRVIHPRPLDLGSLIKKFRDCGWTVTSIVITAKVSTQNGSVRLVPTGEEFRLVAGPKLAPSDYPLRRFEVMEVDTTDGFTLREIPWRN